MQFPAHSSFPQKELLEKNDGSNSSMASFLLFTNFRFHFDNFLVFVNKLETVFLGFQKYFEATFIIYNAKETKY